MHIPPQRQEDRRLSPTCASGSKVRGHSFNPYRLIFLESVALWMLSFSPAWVMYLYLPHQSNLAFSNQSLYHSCDWLPLRGLTIKFKTLLEKDEDDRFMATCPSLPGCISQGKTEPQAIKNMREAIHLHIKALAEDRIPLKSRGNKKEILVSVAL